MALIQIEQVEKSFGAQVLFAPFTAQVTRGDRIALVGDNGVGKSTLLSIIAGVEAPSGGRIHRASGLRIGYLQQIARLEGDGTLFAVMRQPFRELIAADEELRRLESRMAKTNDSEALHRYDDLLHTFERSGGYTIEAKIRTVLSGVGFAAEEFDKPLSRLSGGEEARASLARVLLEEPDLLLLDEPTNHLDFAALDWLEETLLAFSGAMLLVSHDRHLLNRVANRTWEIAIGEVTTYRVGYNQSRALRETKRTHQLVAYKQQQATIERHKAFIRRHHAGQKHRQAKDREHKIEKIEKVLVERPRETKRISVQIDVETPSGKRVLTTEGLKIGYERPVFCCPTLSLYRGERVAIIGENGCGKTTFLRTIAGEIPPLSGKIILGHNVQLGIFRQTQEGLHGNETVLDAILATGDLSISEGRGLLGRFLFSGDEVTKKMRALSGGERSRVALALLSLMKGNVLLLDEPTNHLDLASQEILEEALLAYEGTILLVSHDRALLESLATQVWEIQDGKLRVFLGSYSDYTARIAARRAASETVTQEPKRKQAKKPSLKEEKPDRYQKRRRLEALKEIEEEIETLEAKLKAVEQELLDTSRCGDGRRIGPLGADHKRLSDQLEKRYAEWERLSASID